MESKLKTHPKVAIVAGLERELRFIKKISNIKTFQGYSKNALIAAKKGLSENPDVIISFGFAGSINPKVLNGKVIIPQKIIDKFGKQKNVSKEYSEFFKKRIIGKVYEQNLMTLDKVEYDLNNKKYLKRKISFVDMESSYVQQEAIKKKIPFITLRVIFDDLNFSIPRFLEKCIDKNGNLIFFKLLVNLILKPNRILKLIELSKKYNKASFILKKISNEAFRSF